MLRKLSVLLACLLLCLQTGCAEGPDLVDEWFIMRMDTTYDLVLTRTADGYTLEGLPYDVTVTVEDNSLRITDEEGAALFTGEVYYDTMEYTVFVMDLYEDPAVMYLQRREANQWTVYTDDAETVLITPTQIIDADGKRTEYYFVDERLFIVDDNGYDKFSLEVIADDTAEDVIKMFNLRTGQTLLLIRTIN